MKSYYQRLRSFNLGKLVKVITAADELFMNNEKTVFMEIFNDLKHTGQKKNL